MTTTTHTYHGADLRIHIGGAEGESDSIKADVTFSYLPGDPGCRTLRNGDPGWPPSGAEVEAIKVVPLSNACVADTLSRGELKELGQEWLDGDGYDAACDLAWNERKGDYE